jgi:ADP-ribose pyrophosphatase YjhB (NUDIX family)
MAGKWIVRNVIFPYWRMTRGMTLGAQGIVLDGDSVLLIRHGYRPGWHFPGGGVDWGETAEAAMRREVFEEVGVIVEAAAWHGFFANFATAPCDHIAVFVVRKWRQPAVPAPTREIAEQRFFPLDGLPEDIAGGARRRLSEITTGSPPSPLW